ncbi:serine/threonine phosphatase stp [Abditibacteriota bacterium]|nr:serine/threonine phosphatase stp [Abditibacteriota bacterium]
MFSFFKKRAAAKAKAPETAQSQSPPETEEEVPTGVAFDVSVISKTDVGCVRELNEDSVYVLRPDSPEKRAQKGVLVVVCDGMGGHAGGEVASQLAVTTIAERYMNSSQPVAPALRAALLAANHAILEKAKRDSSLKGMGTTGTALVLRGSQAYYAHVGDSRLYLVRGGSIYQMSEEHSAVMEMVRRGLISPEEARGHPQKNVILRAIGTQPQVEVALWDEPFPLRAGDKWILCSDGLSDLVEDDELLVAVNLHGLDAAGDSLVAMARSRGGHDNISVIIVEVLPVQISETEAEEKTATDEENINAGVPVETREVKIT